MSLFEVVVLSLLVANLGVTFYVAWRAPQVLSRPFIQALGEKEGELLLLRATVQAAQQRFAQLEAEKQGSKELAKPSQ